MLTMLNSIVDGSATKTRTLKGDDLASQSKDPRDHESPAKANEYAREVVEAKRKRGYEDAAQPNEMHGLRELEVESDDSNDFESPKKKKKSSHKKHKKHKDKDKKKKKKHKDRDRDRSRSRDRDRDRD